MSKPLWKVVPTHKLSQIPTKRLEDSGYDVYTVQEEDVMLLQGEKFNFNTGLIMEIDQEWGIFFWEKGGFGNKNLSIRAGLTDSGYRGELVVIVTNVDIKPVIFTRNPEKYDSVAKLGKVTVVDLKKALTQIVLMYTPHVKPLVADISDLSSSDRGAGKFGSSGK